MSFKYSQLVARNLFCLIFLTFSRFATATLSLQSLQPIASFPPSCEAAYQTPVKSCPDADSFSASLFGPPSGQSICTTECFTALISAIDNIQRACQAVSAPPGTVIAHAFTGDLARFLCTPGSASSSSGATITGPPPTSSSSASASPTGGESSSESSTASIKSSTKSTSTEGSSSDSATATATATSTASSETTTSSTGSSSSSPSLSSSSSPTHPTQTTKSIATKASSTISSSSRPEATLGPGGGGSPFDQVVPNAVLPIAEYQSMVSLAIGIAFAIVLGS